MSIFKYVTLVALTMLAQITISQSINLQGYVKCNGSELPVSGAIVSIQNGKLSTTSNKDGFFILKCKNEKNLTLLITHIAYVDTLVSMSNYINEKLLTIMLQESPMNLSEVEIIGETSGNISYSIEKITTNQLRETNITDLGSLMREEPNVGGIKKGATGIDPVIRGFKYSQVVIQLNDGIKIEGGCPNRMDPTASHVNINDVSSIAIFKGPFALKYGPGFGGLVIIETNKPKFYNKYENHISIIIGGQSNQLGYRSGIKVDGGNKFISYNIGANRNKFGDYEAGNGDIVKSSSDNYNINGALGFKFAEAHNISLDAEKSWGRNVDFPTLPMDERSDDTEIYSLSYSGLNIGPKINFIKVKAYLSDVNHEMDNKNRPFSDTVVAVSKIHAANYGGKLSVNMNTLAGKLELGSNIEQVRKNGDRYKSLIMQPGLPTIEENLWNEASTSNVGLYAEYQRMGKRADLIIALRTDYNTAASGPMLRLKKNGDVVYENTDTKSEYFNFSFSGGVNWHLNQKVDLTASLGKGTRSPDMTERFIILLPVGFDPYDYLGNPQLLPETNYELDLGIVRNCRKSGQFKAAVFFSYVADYISAVIVPPSIVKPQTKGVLGVKNFINIGEAYLTGFEIKYTTPESNLWQVRLSAAYTMGVVPSATKIIYENGNAIDEEMIKNDPLPEIPPLEASLWINYKFFKRRLIPELHFRFVASQNKVSQAYYENTTPGFNLLNFRLNYIYNNNLSLTFGINNILNTTYYEHLNRRIIGSKNPFYEPGRVIYTNLIIKL